MVNFDPSRDKKARENLDVLWRNLSQGGMALMPLDKYPFSERYGWIRDQYAIQPEQAVNHARKTVCFGGEGRSEGPSDLERIS
jgi:hypothetical protein